MSYSPPNPNGSATSANSSPVVIASDQAAVATQLAKPVSAQACSNYYRRATADTNAQVIKASAGILTGIIVSGRPSTVFYLKLFNKATTPTVGTDTPFMNFTFPAYSSNGAVMAITLPPQGIAFSNGLGMCIVQGSDDANTTGIVSAGDLLLMIQYV